MDDNSRTGGSAPSDTASPALPNPRHDTTRGPKALTLSERDLLLLKQSEIRFVSIVERVHAEAKRAYEEWSHFTAMRDQAHIDGKELKPSLRIGGFDGSRPKRGGNLRAA